MAAKKKSTTQKKQFDVIQKLAKHPWILLIVIIGLGFFLKHQVEVLIDANKFKEYSTVVKTFGDEVASETKPDEAKIVEYCDRTNHKLAKGGLHCNSQYYLRYKSVTEADVLSIDKILADKISLRYVLSKQGKDETVAGSVASGGFSLQNGGCGYELKQSNEGLVLSLSSGYPFDPYATGTLLMIYCSDSAKANHYKYVEY